METRGKNRRKLDELKIGPYEIVEKISNSIYRVNTGHKKMESNLFHITKLIPVPTLEEKEALEEKEEEESKEEEEKDEEI